jgi:O-antigen/teichoic acid export membrane protein
MQLQKNTKSPSLGAQAVNGGLWTALQVVVNKGVSMLGTLINLYLLSPGEVGIASVALSTQSLIMVLPAFTMTDALIARPTLVRSLIPKALRHCILVSIPMVVAILAWGWWKAGAQHDGDYMRAATVVAFRPVVDLLIFGTQTRLRTDLAFAVMARIDMGCFIASTVLSVVMAATGFGFLSILLPPIMFTAVRALLYRVAEQAPDSQPTSVPPAVGRAIMHEYVLSGLGQYVHGGLIMTAPLILVYFFDEVVTGLFQNAFQLSAVINSIVATGIGLVLQPIFAQMRHDRLRQQQAFVRACTVIAAVAMPACLCQAVLAGPALRLVLPEKWLGVIPMTVLMSLGMAFCFAVNPAMALLKAQGRFTTFLIWQGAQFVAVTSGMLLVGQAWSHLGPLPIVAVYGLYHVVMSPIGVYLCVRGEGLAASAQMAIFVRPLVAAIIALVPVAGLCWVSSFAPVQWQRDTLIVLLVPIGMLMTYPPCLKRLDANTYSECWRFLEPAQRALARISLRRKP